MTDVFRANSVTELNMAERGHDLLVSSSTMTDGGSPTPNGLSDGISGDDVTARPTAAAATVRREMRVTSDDDTWAATSVLGFTVERGASTGTSGTPPTSSTEARRAVTASASWRAS